MGMSSACVQAGGAGGVPSLGGFFPGRSPTLAASCPAGQGEHEAPPHTDAQSSRLFKGPVLLGRG